MARKKSSDQGKKRVNPEGVMGLHAEVLEQPITDTLEINYMPYAMSVIISRAIPEIDGFKPADPGGESPCGGPARGLSSPPPAAG